MKLYVYTDSLFKKTLWFMHIFLGISEEAKHRHYEPVLLDEIPEDINELQSEFGGEKPVVIVAGNSEAALCGPLEKLWNGGIHTVLVNYTEDVPSVNSSVIIMDYAEAVVHGIDALENSGCGRIALLGAYPDSEPDKVKCVSFVKNRIKAGIIKPEEDIFTVDGSLGECIEKFCRVNEKYDSVICCNDLAAVALSRAANDGRTGKKQVAGFADSLISDFSILVPGIITLSAEHGEFGRQAVRLVSWLQKNKTELSVTVRVPAKENAEESRSVNAFEAMRNFKPVSEDLTVNAIMRVERCIAACDATDIIILRGLFLELPRSVIAELAFMTERAVNYRLKRLCMIGEVSDTCSLVKLLKPWIPRSGE